MNNEKIVVTVVGNVVNEPEERSAGGRPVVEFRLAATESRPDGQGGFVDRPSNFFTVTCWDPRMGRNIQQSFRKGNRVIVHGQLDVAPFTDSEGQSKTRPNIRVWNCGHALTFGASEFRKIRRDAEGRVLEPAGAFAGVSAAQAADPQLGVNGRAERAPEDREAPYRTPSEDAESVEGASEGVLTGV